MWSVEGIMVGQWHMQIIYNLLQSVYSRWRVGWSWQFESGMMVVILISTILIIECEVAHLWVNKVLTGFSPLTFSHLLSQNAMITTPKNSRSRVKISKSWGSFSSSLGHFVVHNSWGHFSLGAPCVPGERNHEQEGKRKGAHARPQTFKGSRKRKACVPNRNHWDSGRLYENCTLRLAQRFCKEMHFRRFKGSAPLHSEAERNPKYANKSRFPS